MENSDTTKLEELFGVPVVIVDQYDLRQEPIGRTKSFDTQEIIESKELVINHLTNVGVEELKPKLIFVDNKDNSNIITIFAIFENNSNKKLHNDITFSIKDGKIIQVIESKK